MLSSSIKTVFNQCPMEVTNSALTSFCYLTWLKVGKNSRQNEKVTCQSCIIPDKVQMYSNYLHLMSKNTAHNLLHIAVNQMDKLPSVFIAAMSKAIAL